MPQRALVAIAAFTAAVAVGCTGGTAETATVDTTAPPEAATSTTTTVAPVTTRADVVPLGDLGAYLDEVASELLRRQPELATEVGVGGALGTDGFLDSVSVDAVNDTAAYAEAALARLEATDRTASTPQLQLSVDVLRWHLSDVVTMAQWYVYEYPLSFITGRHTNLPEFLLDVHPVTTAEEAEAYIDRLEAIEIQIAQLISLTTAQRRVGIEPTEGGMEIAGFQLRGFLDAGGSATHPLVTDFADRLAAIDELADQQRTSLVSRATNAMENTVLPAYERLLAAITGTGARMDVIGGAWAHPDGHTYYAAALRHHLSLDLSAEEVHAAGLEEVARVTAEMTVALERLGYSPGDDFAGTVGAARRDAGGFPTTSEAERAAALRAAAALVDDADRRFSAAFQILPETAVAVVRPRAGRESGAGGYYRPPPIDGSRDGIYYLSMGGSQLSKWSFASTTYHEALPGHHFQLARQRQAADLPLHQRAFTFTGHVEGWALYAERLAFELGAYSGNPYGNLGRLHLELLRAGRMVVDTGIHSRQWSRQEGIDYLTALGFPEGQAAGEVDRYIVWPGQAPAYLVGMLEILRLRSEAQEALGDAFDLAAFHEAVLSHGSIPLDLLDDAVALYIASA